MLKISNINTFSNFVRMYIEKKKEKRSHAELASSADATSEVSHKAAGGEVDPPEVRFHYGCAPKRPLSPIEGGMEGFEGAAPAPPTLHTDKTGQSLSAQGRYDSQPRGRPPNVLGRFPPHSFMIMES